MKNNVKYLWYDIISCLCGLYINYLIVLGNLEVFKLKKKFGCVLYVFCIKLFREEMRV